MNQLFLISVTLIAIAIIIGVGVTPLINQTTDLNKLDENNILTDSNLTDEKINELLNALENCDQIEQIFSKDDYYIKAKIISKNESKCNVNFELIRAPGIGMFGIGSQADCRLTKEEVEHLMQSFEFDGLDCNGQLFELAKTYFN